jgi:hypothetical protein
MAHRGRRFLLEQIRRLGAMSASDVTGKATGFASLLGCTNLFLQELYLNSDGRHVRLILN